MCLVGLVQHAINVFSPFHVFSSFLQGLGNKTAAFEQWSHDCCGHRVKRINHFVALKPWEGTEKPKIQWWLLSNFMLIHSKQNGRSLSNETESVSIAQSEAEPILRCLAGSFVQLGSEVKESGGMCSTNWYCLKQSLHHLPSVWLRHCL